MSKRRFSGWQAPRWLSVLLACLVTAASLPAQEAEKTQKAIDFTTLDRKTMCGYQGWFRTPGDGTGDGWRHWSRNGRRITPQSLTFEMWPDMSEYSDDEQHVAGDFTYENGSPAHLFSSANAKTVDRHFDWMKQYEIDGVFLQRFLVETKNPSLDVVLKNVRAASARHGRAYALCYDLSGQRAENLYDTIVADWKKLVDEQKVTQDKNYLHHRGKPVLFVWGFFSDRFDAALAHKLIDFFQAEGPYGVTLIGGCQWHWRAEKNAAWAQAFRRFHVISPWNVGHVERVDGEKHAATHYWKDDMAEAKRAGMQYFPVIYPGFGWRNLNGETAASADIPRLKGSFYWRQFYRAKELGAEMAYIAMFDEVDEATAIFKVTNSPPKQAKFQTYEGLPTDWYLRLTQAGGKLLRGESPNSRTIPIRP